MHRFVKRELFTMNGKTYKVLSNHVHDKRLPPSPRKDDSHNAVEFIEVVQELDMGEYVWKEVKPVSIKSQVKRELTLTEKVHDEYVEFGSKVYPKTLMYDLLDNGYIKELPIKASK
jgi:hypothetical protein